MRRLILLFCMVIFLTIVSRGNNKEKIKPDNFPTKAIELVKGSLVDSLYLDTLTILSTNFDDIYARWPKDSIGNYKTVTDKKFLVSLQFDYVQSILILLSNLEQNIDNEDLKNGFLFKLEIELKNRPLSYKDLTFTYRNWYIKNRK